VNSSKLSYRAEIDGLRAIAVVSVILYHAQMVLFGRDWFEGGFIGVDIFFVISGYLITRIILSELESKGSFSFMNFYERRARRILPMLFVVIFVSMPYAWQKLLPSDFVEYAESILASLFFGSNFFFYFSTTEYGADSALLKPFLHTWSLGVEEQFYIVFPILAIVAFKYFRKHFLSVLIGLSLLSLHFAELMEVQNSDLNFYLPFSRFWELAVGSMLAYRELYYKPSNEVFASKSLPMIGLYLIAYSILFFDAKTPHPSFHTLIPIIGVALIIGFASKDELVGKVLGSKPFVWLGLISYSAYLWHFPIFAFTRIEFGGMISEFMSFLGVLLTFGLSAISYRFVEKPFRKKTNVQPKFFLVLISLSSLLVIVLACLVIANNGLKDRFQKIEGFSNFELDNGALRDESWKPLREREKSAPLLNKNVKERVLIVGNSHAKDMFNLISSNLSSLPSVDVLRGDVGELACFVDNPSDDADEIAREKFFSNHNYEVATLLIVSTKYFHNNRCLTKDRRKKIEPYVDDLLGLSELIEKAKLDGKRVVVFGNTAEFSKIKGKGIVADAVFKDHKDNEEALLNARSNNIINSANKLLFTKLKKKIDGLNARVKKIAEKHNVQYVDKQEIVCDFGSESCYAFTDLGFKTLYDHGHWTLEGAEFFGQRFFKNKGMEVFE